MFWLEKMNKYFRNIRIAEKEGLGTLYEYISKLRVYNALVSKKFKKVLLLGLPEKYGSSLAVLIFFPSAKFTVVDPRKERLVDFEDFTKHIISNVSVKLVKSDIVDYCAKKNFDLIINTEVIQQFRGKELIKLVSTIYRLASGYVVLFIPNRDCYAHPKISGLQAYSLEYFENYIKQNSNFEIISKGYVDIPPWPAGFILPNGKANRFSGLFTEVFRFIRIALVFPIPFLVILERFYPVYFKKRQAHMIYLILRNQ